MKKHLILFCLFMAVSFTALAESPFAVIMYDEKTEKEVGAFPPKRTIWAHTIDKCREYGAKAVVLKFFYDMPREEDKVFAVAMDKIPVFLQACLNNEEPSLNPLDRKYSIDLGKRYTLALSGDNGWIPVPVLAEKAYDIGFVDVQNVNEIPLVEQFKGKYYKSLCYAVLLYIYPGLKIENDALVHNNKKIKLSGNLEMHVNYPEKDNLDYIPLCDFLNGKAGKKDVEHKIAIIGWDGNNSGTFAISTGKVRTHRVFVYGLLDMYDQVKRLGP
ncbi:MAG: CHASE2 domain-containing protein [Spirochaetales bacterium]|nr:CHASE2 domain-containing protein [Spirochaetales bacterium]